MRVGRTYVYERSSSQNQLWSCGFVGVCMTALTVFLAVTGFSMLGEYRDVSASLGSLIVHPSVNSNVPDPAHNGDVVHVTIAPGELATDHALYDPAFQLTVPGAVTLERRVEYCQWQEHVHERTERTSDNSDTERVVRTYTYTKGWTSSPVNSLFFDQPAAHFNPQRRPVAAGRVDTAGITSARGFRIGAQDAQHLRSPTTTYSFRPESLQSFVTSPAAMNDHFFYTGNNGWFLSKYTPSTAEKAMKMAFEYAEGTLLDFQLGDLFSVCDAGDVRVALEGKVPVSGVSVVALQTPDGTLVPFRTLQGRPMMLLQEGQHSVPDMVKAEVGARFRSLVWRTVGTLASAALAVVAWRYVAQAYAARKALQDTNKNE